MANIRVSAAVTTVLSVATTATVINLSAVGGVSAVAAPISPIRVTAFVVPMEFLEEQTVLISDFRAFRIDQVTIDVSLATDDVAIVASKVLTDEVTASDASFRAVYGSIDFDPSDDDVDPDPITATDAVNTIGVSKVLTDATEASETDVKSVGKAASDSVSASEAINTKDVGKSLSDTAAAADEVNTFAVDRVSADTTTIADADAKSFERGNTDETVVASDDSFRSPVLAKASDVTPADTLNSFNIGKNPSDTATPSDAINSFAVATVLADTVTMTDFIAKTPAYEFDFDTQDADADPDPVTATDVMAKSFTRPDIADTATASDATAKTLNTFASDTATATEATAFNAATVRTDTVTATEALATSPAKVATDTATATDAVNSFAQNKTTTDSVTGTDAVNLFAVAKALADATTVTEVINILLTLGQSNPLYDFAFASDDKFTYFPVMGTINSHLIHQPLINGEFVLTIDPNAGIVYTIRTESASYMYAGYGLNENQLN